MGKRCSQISAFKRFSALGPWMILASLLIWSPPADAGLLNEVTAPVRGATAPVKDVVKTVIPPAPPSTPSPPADSPTKPVATPVKVPSTPPASVPATQVVETTKHVAETATGAVTTTGTETVSDTGAGVEMTSSAGSAAVGPSAGSPRDVGKNLTGDPAKTQAASGAAERPAAAISPGDATMAPSVAAARAGTAARFGIDLLAGIRAMFLRRPFVYVWPAVVLTEGSLGTVVGSWSEATITLLDQYGTGSLRGTPPAEGAIGQEASSSSSSSSLPGFASRIGEAALPALLSFVVAAIGILAILAVMRRERGLPLISRRVRWRH
jgi:hypothetical protein